MVAGGVAAALLLAGLVWMSAARRASRSGKTPTTGTPSGISPASKDAPPVVPANPPIPEKPTVIVSGAAQGSDRVTLNLGDGVTLELARIPAETFLMGSLIKYDEKQHEVTISKPFYMGIHLVTQEQYQAVMGTNPSQFKDREDSARRPVEQVSWSDAVEFCKKLSEKTGRNARLPTEAEWEYACRAGTTTEYSFGDAISAEQANFRPEGMSEEEMRAKNRAGTTPVGTFPANAWGLYDMHGNVSEWCADWYGEYPAEAVTDPQGPEEGPGRVIRSGAFNSDLWELRSTLRQWNTKPDDSRHSTLGFRIALD